MSKKSVAPIKTLARYEPDTVYIGAGEYVAECVRADDGDYYLAADADAAIEALQAEIERLREQLRLATVDQGTAEAEANDARAEVEALRAERDALAKDAARYAIARRMSPQRWADAWELNYRTGKPFDEIIDDLAPFFGAVVAWRGKDERD